VDFVIVGFGLGSLILLLGIAARDLGPRLQANPRPATSLNGDASARPAPKVKIWRRLTPLAGPTIMLGGALIILATLAGILLQLSDSEGSRLVLAGFVVAVVGLVARLPFLARARPKVAKPKIERWRPPPAPSRERQRPARAARPNPLPSERPQPVRRRPAPEPVPSYQPGQNGRSEELSERAPRSPIPDLPDIFSSDEPIQTGLLEKLLAEDDARSRREKNEPQHNRHDPDNGSTDREDQPWPSVSERSAK
jgi:hypothetical protein